MFSHLPGVYVLFREGGGGAEKERSLPIDQDSCTLTAILSYEFNYFHISQKRGSPAKICNASPIRRDNAYV
jgi:hypothetical protein